MWHWAFWIFPFLYHSHNSDLPLVLPSPSTKFHNSVYKLSPPDKNYKLASVWEAANESINKINGSVWGHVPHQLISGITSPPPVLVRHTEGVKSLHGRNWKRERRQIRRRGREEAFSALWWIPSHPPLVTGLLFPSFNSARSRFLLVGVCVLACAQLHLCKI